MTFAAIWFGAGIVCSASAFWAIRLSFRDQITLGTVLGLIFGCAVPPLALLSAFIFACMWAFGDYDDQRYMAKKWPPRWTRFRYGQHRLVRYAWYLGAPPAQEDILSGWRNYR